MAAPIGNQNATKSKQWTAAIERALERRGDASINPDEPIARSPRMKALDELAEKFLAGVEMPSNGMQGFKELGDRLDGKPAQPIEGPDGAPLFGPMVEAGEVLRGKMR